MASEASLSEAAIEYRLAGPDDALCIAVLAMQVFLDTYTVNGMRPDLARETLEIYAPEAFARRQQDPATTFILAERAGHLIAFAELTLDRVPPHEARPGAAELVRLYVQRYFKRMGLGRELLNRAEALACSQGASNLWLTTWSGNTAARAFYPTQGYRDIGLTSYTIQGSAYENRVFAKALTAGI
ncbi:GNAT family N-acetyltransferase [Roseateles toxinivorans]|uniref:Ribosomal protein S18 acetylase RimI-like enzyme n=1 Tax=Roseateles toxinivorans TaxID=270368 RepID=A0A4R6QLZ8_9BURK|nr:GNAT family N-acetyltransferase [Roseateles toxinivorans]TDP64209.1 ribosomal protein S18 acetylase RimI-like enzyme [Roseateles toxinivorans]